RSWAEARAFARRVANLTGRPVVLTVPRRRRNPPRWVTIRGRRVEIDEKGRMAPVRAGHQLEDRVRERSELLRALVEVGRDHVDSALAAGEERGAFLAGLVPGLLASERLANETRAADALEQPEKPRVRVDERRVRLALAAVGLRDAAADRAPARPLEPAPFLPVRREPTERHTFEAGCEAAEVEVKTQ